MWEKRLRLSWGNDAIAAPLPSDDDGFTNDVSADLRLRNERYDLGFSVRDRLITERRGPNRWDELTTMTSVGFRFGDFTVGPRLGLALGGDFGGAKLQDGFHALPGVRGRRLGAGLQSQYEGDVRAGIVIGFGASFDRALGAGFFLSSQLQLDIAPGDTGVTAFEHGHALSFQRSFGLFTPRLEVALALTRYTSNDARLLMPGGYDTTQFHLEPRLSACLSVGPVSLGVQWRMNEGGAGHALGVATLGVVF